MQVLLKTTAAGAALAAALFLPPLSLVAQEAPPDVAGAPGAASDPAAGDETTVADDTTAEDASIAEEGAATATAEDDPGGPRLAVEGEERDVDIFVGDILGPNGGATAEGEDDTVEAGEDGPDTGDRLAAAIASAEAAAADLQVAAERLPAIVERIDAIVARVEQLPIEDLVTELTSLASSANALVSSEATQALPADLSATLGEVGAILREIREGGVVENANATLQSTRAAADTLPGLAERAGVLLDQAGTTLEGFEGSGRVVREAEQALREVARAAEAVASLARAIENDPNSLIFGD